MLFSAWQVCLPEQIEVSSHLGYGDHWGPYRKHVSEREPDCEWDRDLIKAASGLGLGLHV